MGNTDLETQTEIIAMHFGKSPEELLNEEVLSWIDSFSERFRQIWESGECSVCEIMKRLYN